MEAQSDFCELLASFNAHGVEYLIVGAYALALHGVPRSTGDIDVLVNPEPANARRVVAALDAYGFGSLGLCAADFEQADQVVQLGRPPVRIDLMTSITGVSWLEAAKGRVMGELGGIPVAILGRDQLIANKRATGRARDLADIEALDQGPGDP
jgi:hypothetical protein